MQWMLALFVPVIAMAGGSVEGTIVDVTGEGLDSLVRLIPKDSAETKYHTYASHDGRFAISDVDPGAYVLRANLSGFRTKVMLITVREGEVTNIGKVLLPPVDCEAPGMICDSVGPEPRRPIFQGETLLRLGCGMDLEKGHADCKSYNKADLKFELRDGRLYLSLVHGAKLRESGDPEIRIDGSGRGDDWWIVTHSKHTAHVFIASDVVEPGSKEIVLYVTTR